MAQILSCSQRVYNNYDLDQRDILTEILIRLADFHGTATTTYSDSRQAGYALEMK